MLDWIHPDSREVVRSRLGQLVAGEAVPLIEETFLRKDGSPFEVRPRGAAAVLCGVFNCDLQDPAIAAFQDPLPGGVPRWRDAWNWRAKRL